MSLNNKQRGSIEIVILIIVFAVVIGLIFWRYSEAEKAQIDAETALESEQDLPNASTQQRQVVIEEMALGFSVSPDAGDITYAINESGAAQLKSSKLANKSECADDVDGMFALLRTSHPDDATVSDDFKATVDGRGYTVQVDYQTCYNEADRAEFDRVAQRIASSLHRVDVGFDTSE